MMYTSANSKDANALFDALLSMENSDEIQRFLADLCTPSEIEAMVQRYLVARMLRDGKTGSEIVRRTGSSTATISRVNRSLRYGHQGYELALVREENERERNDGPE